MGCIQKKLEGSPPVNHGGSLWINCQRKPTEMQRHIPFSLSRWEPQTAFKAKLRNDPLDKVRLFLCLSKKWTFSISTVDENVIFLFAISISQLTGIYRDREF